MFSGARLQVDPEQAKIIQEIFELYASGLSIKATTKKLNAEHTQSPRPRAGRERSWAPSTVRDILANRRYIGVVTYGRTRKVRNPTTGKRIYKNKPESEWREVAEPEQRIVSDELWNAVQARLAFVNRVYSDSGARAGLLRSRAASSKYIFSGLLKCGECGGAITIVSGKGRTHRAAFYGCPAQEYRNTCKNERRIRSDRLETQLLGKLQQAVLSPEAIDYCFHRLEVELSKHLGRIDTELETMRRRRAKLDTELGNLMRMAADGMDSPSLRQAITEREAEISTLTAKSLGRGKCSVHTQIRDLRKFVEVNLQGLRELLSSGDNALAMRMELAKHVQEIVIAQEEGGEIKYKGEWDLLGDAAQLGVCRGPESDWLRRPFQGRALPMSYLGTRTMKDSTEKSGWGKEKTAGKFCH